MTLQLAPFILAALIAPLSLVHSYASIWLRWRNR